MSGALELHLPQRMYEALKLDDANFLEYLSRIDVRLARPKAFPRQLSLPFMHEIIVRLRNSESQDRYFMDEEARSGVRRAYERMGLPYDADNPAEIMGEGERSLAVGFNPRSRKFYTTPVEHLDVFGGRIHGFMSIIEDDDHLVMNAHTHPWPQLASPEDLRLLTYDLGYGIPACKAETIVTPVDSYLLLATSETLMLDNDQFAARKELIEEQLNDGLGRNVAIARHRDLTDEAIRIHESGMEALFRIGTFFNPRPLRMFGPLAIRTFGKYHEFRLKRIQRKIVAAAEPAFLEEIRLNNNYLALFAHSMGLQMYRSTDDENFVAFSA